MQDKNLTDMCKTFWKKNPFSVTSRLKSFQNAVSRKTPVQHDSSFSQFFSIEKVVKERRSDFVKKSKKTRKTKKSSLSKFHPKF